MRKKEADVNFFLTNNSGGYISIGKNDFSQYNGAFFFIEDEMELYKTLESIETIDRKELSGRFAYNDKTIIYESDKIENFVINVDFRRIHDFNDQGRIYTTKKDKKYIIIKYDKYEDDSLQKIKETFYLAIKTNDASIHESKLLSEWHKKNYSYDNNRGTRSEFYVYKCLEIQTDKLVFGFGKTEIEAKNNSEKNAVFEEEQKSIMKIAENSIERFIVNLKRRKIQGMFAGFPWFYQIWGRDELITLGGLIASEKYELSKKIIFRNLANLNKGFVPNRIPASDLTSIDSTGWLYKRTADLLVALHKNKKLGTHITKKELETIYSRLKESINAYKSRMENDLIINKPLETWMDTTDSRGIDSRAGARVEIQCLFMNICSLASYLSKILDQSSLEYELLEKKCKNATLKELFKEGILHDGKNQDLDHTIRPNVFLAHHIYPQLLTNKEWEQTFDKTIRDCWLEWGGFSSISKNSSLYQRKHTGFNNESYHRGDSWYYLNNIAAIALLKVNNKKYAELIEKITEASIHDLLFLGIRGQCSEISSAEEQRAEGCLAQAWSSSTLIELIKRLS